MECGCLCDDSACGMVEFYDRGVVIARKQHRCCECREMIPQGQQYEYARGKADGSFYTAKTCLTCARIRDAYCCCEHGALRELLWDALGVDYVTGETIDDEE